MTIFEELSKRSGQTIDQHADAIAIRTKIIDDYLLECLENNIQQVVVLGCGVCMRTRRLNLDKNIKIYELDLHDLIE